ncbi:MAG: type II 3-dehydroquinate dehydratase [Bacteroidales bacterium]|jgi:3-dehydroquinate dehydratase-2|nr:type II 3-dehydroquinate dehydratase [Bacteroidales bacterium]
MKRITIINGPNLNLLGKREVSVYGKESFEDFFEDLKNSYPDLELKYLQTNVEGTLIDYLQQENGKDGIVLNAAGYTHTSVSIADAVRAIETPVVEVHISNIFAREEFRHTSLIAPHCKGSIIGLGLNGYKLAIDALLAL